MTVTRDVNDYSVFTASVDTNIFYVSNSGNDTTGNGSIGNPYATPKKAFTFATSGNPDWILLEEGGTWNTSDLRASANTNLNFNGRSQQEPFVIGSYHASNRALLTPELPVSAQR